MTKKKQTLFQHATAVSLVLLLLFGMAMPAVASQEPDPNTMIGTKDEPIEAVIAKRLLTSYFTNPQLPIEFTFEFTPLSFTPEDMIEDTGYEHPAYNFGTNSEADIMPKLEDGITITIDSTSPVIPDRPNGRKSIWQESGDIFAGVEWPEAGIYRYSLKETDSDFEEYLGDEYEDWMRFSPAVYYIEVYVVVADWETVPQEDGYYIAALAMRLSENPAEIDFWWEEIIAEGGGEEEGDKIDPTSFDIKGNGDYSDAVFTNRYFKDNSGPDPDPEDPGDLTDDDTVFRLDKVIEDTNGGANFGKYFAFDITITKPTFMTETPEPYRAFVMEMVGDPTPEPKIVTSTDNGTVITGSGPPHIEFVSGMMQTVSLKDGQWLALVDAPEGSAIVVKEQATPGYTPSYRLVLNGGLDRENPGSDAEDTGDVVSKTDNVVWGFPPFYTLDQDPLTDEENETAFIGEPLNWAIFTNTFKRIPITGIAMDNMPYYILIGLAVLGFAAYVMVRLRRNAKYTAQNYTTQTQ